jgi:twitching motility protein PilT
MTLNKFLKFLVQKEGSDIHICAGRKPYVRIHGQLHGTELGIIRPGEVKDIIYSVLTDEQKEYLQQHKELDFSYMLPELSRFRINVYLQRGTFAVVVRAVPFQVRSFEELGIPEVVKHYVESLSGMVAVTGYQGTGKSTTLAAIVDHINRTRKAHIITIEDPIEYYHKSIKSIVNQREVGRDTDSYLTAMRYVLRQDPDVCLVGEIRDPESVRAALALAEAGTLVLTTVHSPTAPKTISRLVDMFPTGAQQQICMQLSLVLNAVISQQLVPSRNKDGRVLACEVMKVTGSIENMIRTYSLSQIRNIIQTKKDEGMQTMDQALFDLYKKGLISVYELKKRAIDRKQVDIWIMHDRAS